MKKSILYFIILLLISIPGYSQDIIINSGSSTQETIPQILLPGIDDLMNLQALNQGTRNYTNIQQSGNQNTATITQQNTTGPEKSNQSLTTQSGNSNELTLGQIGSGNVLLGYQMGYLSTLTGVTLPGNQAGVQAPTANTTGSTNTVSGYLMEGDHNQLNISQNGNNNGVMAVQQGSYNTISAEQNGNNNYLLALQKGFNNSLTGYKQENESDQILYDRVVQIGDNLSLKSDEVSKSSVKGNTFMQTGTNLSLEIKSDLINTAGGLDISQTGKDMKVVIDQSYFSFPLK
jgi:hypothetical protein